MLRPLIIACLALGCLEAVEDPRPPPAPLEQDGGTFDPGRRPPPGQGYGSGSGSGSGSGARDLPDQGADASAADAGEADAEVGDAEADLGDAQ